MDELPEPVTGIGCAGWPVAVAMMTSLDEPPILFPCPVGVADGRRMLLPTVGMESWVAVGAACGVGLEVASPEGAALVGALVACKACEMGNCGMEKYKKRIRPAGTGNQAG